MTHGLPVITSPMGAGSIVRDEVDGVVIPSYDAEAWIPTLRRFAHNAELRNAYDSAARKRAQEFEWSKVAARRAELMLQRLG
jgi:glycosyltransferase involved in cell wall biosynthesis